MRRRQPGDISTTFIFPGELQRALKADCALAGISISEKLIELLMREYSDAIEEQKRLHRAASQQLHDALMREYPPGAFDPPKRKRRQPSQIAPQLAQGE